MQVCNFCADVMILAVDLDPINAGDHGRAPCAPRLKACEQDRVTCIGRKEFQVMKHAAPCRHTARRNDDLGHRIIIECLGVFAFVDIGCDMAGPLRLILAQPVAFGVLAKDFGRINCHRTVEIYGQVRYAIRCL